jgi:hypothetical protein
MADIHVSRTSDREYSVEVHDGTGSTRHLVEVGSTALERFGGGVDAETLLEESFRFLLEREPKEAILRRFEISVIGRYFPEYRAEIRRRLAD